MSVSGDEEPGNGGDHIRVLGREGNPGKLGSLGA